MGDGLVDIKIIVKQNNKIMMILTPVENQFELIFWITYIITVFFYGVCINRAYSKNGILEGNKISLLIFLLNIIPIVNTICVLYFLIIGTKVGSRKNLWNKLYLGDNFKQK